jgi:predicted DsbA family dithiol-disulfide isomerase
MDAEGLPFNEGRHMTYNSRLAQELAKWGEAVAHNGELDDERLNMALYQAYFVDRRNIGDKDVLLDLVEQVGFPVEEARAVLEDRTMQAAVDADWRHAVSIGVTGVPTFAVGLQGVVGAQPYEVLAQLLENNGAKKRK